MGRRRWSRGSSVIYLCAIRFLIANDSLKEVMYILRLILVYIVGTELATVGLGNSNEKVYAR